MTDEAPKLIVKVNAGKSLNRKRQIQSLDGHYVYQDRNQIIEEVALEVEKMQKGFGKDTIDSLTVYIRNMKT
jgi:hypothetical protein